MQLNTRARNATGVALVVIALMFLIPPWQDVKMHSSGTRIMKDRGYSAVFRRPTRLSQIDGSRLALQCLAVLALAGAYIAAESQISTKAKGGKSPERQ